MSPAIITGALLTLMLLIIGSFVFSAWQAQRQHMRELKDEAKDELSTNTGHMAVMVQLLDGSVVGVENPLPAKVTNELLTVTPTAHLPQSWYNRRRTVVSLGLLLMVIIGLLVETGGAGDVFHALTRVLNLSSLQTSGFDLQTNVQSTSFTASTRIVRVDSAQRDQYYNDYQYQTWSYSSCSGISLEEVMNAYGHHYIAADVLQVEQNMGVWNTSQGLTGGEPAMGRVAAHFGFQTNANPPRTLADLIAVANKGTPVIVGSPAHIMVIKGGDANYVYAVDSSPVNRQAMTYDQFLSFWDGFSVLITPN